MPVRSSSLSITIIAAMSLVACDAMPAAKSTTTEAPAAAVQAAPLTPSGPAIPLTAEAETDENLQHAASVVRIDWVGAGSAKMFGTAGGDPAMNGLYTYIAFSGEPADGWVVYSLGNILDYTVLASEIGSVDLDIHESTMDEATGNIGDRHRKVIVSWTPGDDGAPPTGVTITPAQ